MAIPENFILQHREQDRLRESTRDHRQEQKGIRRARRVTPLLCKVKLNHYPTHWQCGGSRKIEENRAKPRCSSQTLRFYLRRSTIGKKTLGLRDPVRSTRLLFLPFLFQTPSVFFFFVFLHSRRFRPVRYGSPARICSVCRYPFFFLIRPIVQMKMEKLRMRKSAWKKKDAEFVPRQCLSRLKRDDKFS